MKKGFVLVFAIGIFFVGNCDGLVDAPIGIGRRSESGTH